MPGDKLSDMVLIVTRVKPVWSGCGGGREIFLFGAVPGDKLSHMVLVGRRAEPVWSGCGGGREIFLLGAVPGGGDFVHLGIGK